MCICGNPSSIQCDVCKQAAFCPECVKTVGWAAHEADCNVVEVEHPDDTVFSPDLGPLTAEQLSRLDGEEQSHITRYVDPKGAIVERLVEASAFHQSSHPLGGGAPVDESHAYRLGIAFDEGEEVFVDLVPVFTEASNDKARRLASLKRHDQSLAVLWGRSPSGGVEVPMHGIVSAKLYIDGKGTPFGLRGHYKVPGGNFFQDAMRKLRSWPLKTEYDIKFGGSMDHSTLVTMKGRDHKGNKLRFTVQVTAGKTVDALLMDAEFVCREGVLRLVAEAGAAQQPPLPPPRDDDSVNVQFRCDSSDLDQVTGLKLALEDYMASGVLTGAAIEQQFHVIRAHCEALERDPSVKASPKVNTAIHGAVQALWTEQIDGPLGRAWDRAKRDRAARKAFKNAAKALKSKTPDQLIADFDSTITEAENLRSAGRNASELINYAKNIEGEIRSRFTTMTISAYPQLTELYGRLETLSKSQNAARFGKYGRSRRAAREKRQADRDQMNLDDRPPPPIPGN